MTRSRFFLAGTALSLLMAGPLDADERIVGGKQAARDGVAILAQLELPESGDPVEGEGGECPPGTAPTGSGACVETQEEEEGEAQETAPAPTEEEAVEPPAVPETDQPVEELEAPVQPSEEPVIEGGEEMPALEEEVPPPAEEETDQPTEYLEPPVESEEEPAIEGGEEAPSDEQPEATPAPAEEEAAPAPAQEETDQPVEELEAPTETEQDPALEGEDVPAEELQGSPEEVAPEAAPEEAAPEAADEAEEVAPGDAEATDEESPEAEAEQPAEEEMEADTQPEAEAETGADVEADEEAAEGEETQPEGAAPVLDSQKREEAEPEATTEDEGEAQPVEEGEEQAVEEAPPPESDEEAQTDQIDPEALRAEIREMMEQEGERIEMGQTPEDTLMRRRELVGQVREDARVIEEYNDNRKIIQYNNNVYIESPDYDRIVMQDDRVYYDDLRDDRVREVIERPDGTRVITIRNRYGDVIRRVRVMPDGREYVLVYVPEDRFEEVGYFEDPAIELGPLQLTIPVSEYILEAQEVDDPDRYYTFLDQPPIEPVRRLYSLEEVKYSPRVRDMMRRVDLDTIEFEFGSARIEESEIKDIEALAVAMERLLEENPAETFLIEGHTDAVGSENANLALSDRRAEAVARALTNVFGLPPENLVTQGYGEQYLKINMSEPTRENRRVAVRRITPLVAPVAERQ